MTPEVAAEFTFADSPAGRILQSAAIARLAPHLITTRGLDFRGDSAARDYQRLAAAMGVGATGLVTVRQVHGRRVLAVRQGEPLQDDLAADAIVSTDPDRAVAVRVADCVPILIADRKQRAVAAVHAGWRGTCAAVAAAVVQTLQEMGIEPADLVAAVGPSIGPCCYQVDDPVRTTFLGVTPDAASWFSEDGPGHWRLDLWTANADQLEAAGVPTAAIHLSRMCSRDLANDFFSYRREGAAAGRTVAAIRLRRAGGR